MKKLNVLENEIGERLDIFLLTKIPGFSRTQIQEGVKKKIILINYASTKSSYKLKANDKISIDFDYFEDLAKPIELIAEKIPLEVLFEDEYILVIDKPTNMVVHPAHGNLSGTLVNALLNYAPEIAESKNDNSNNNFMRPGIVHRLDKDTSGAIIVAKNAKSLSALSKQLANKQIKKKYLALVFGNTAKSGEIRSYLGRDKNDRKKIAVLDESRGKLAITRYKKIGLYSFGKDELSLLSIEIPTGRTHQIRVQLKSIGHPVIGDQTYNSKESKNISDKIAIKRQLLHACKIEFHHPVNNDLIKIESNLPQDFQSILDKLSC